jgi:hypothetical protein
VSDWIKMRTGLLTNPKVTRMARVLLADAEFMAWFQPGREPVTSRDAVTKRDVEVVTRIVVGGLLPTWAAANESVSRDGVMRHVASQDIDDSAGIPGFGRALVAVEWMREIAEEDAVQFVNFEEHNSVQKERSLTAKSGAERTREYRERMRRESEEGSDSSVTRDETTTVTVTSQCDDREEKNREEKVRRATRLPADWSPTPEDLAYAAKVGLVNGKVALEAEKFRDWFVAAPGQKGVKQDWPATWRTWVRKAAEGPPGKGGPASADMFRERGL